MCDFNVMRVLTGVIGNKLRHPVVPSIHDICLSSVNIGKRDCSVALPTIFHISLVIIIADQAIRVIVTFRVERIEDAVVYTIPVSVIRLFSHSQYRLLDLVLE
jgi:hypothetical protein